jgi:RecB family endonuclease NucS
LDDSTDFDDEDIEDALDTSLSLERDLERILLNDLSVIEEGPKLFREGELVGVQLDTGIVGRLDILAIDKQGKYVVIEIKAGEASDRVCGQILRYMGWVSKDISGGKDVRGIIVANDFDEKIKYAVSILPQIDLRKYDVGFTISNVA